MTREATQSRDSILRLGRWVLRYALRRSGGMSLVLVLMIVKVGLALLKPWPMKFLVDQALIERPAPPAAAWLIDMLPGANDRFTLVGWCVAGTVLVFLLSWCLGATSALVNNRFSQRLTFDLAGNLFAHCQRLSWRYHKRKGLGDSIRRITSDSTCVATIVKDAMLPVLTSAITLVLIFAILWQLSPMLTLASLGVVPLMVLAMRRYARPMLELSYRQQEVEGRVYDVVEQTLTAIPVVQAFTREERADRAFAERTRDSLSAALASTSVQLKFKVFIGAATALGTAAILWLGAHQVMGEKLTIGSILVFLSYLASLYAPLEMLAYTSSAAQTAAGSARRVREVLDTSPEVSDRPDAQPLATVDGAVSLAGVTYGYECDRPVLHEISLDVAAGQTVALVGPTGAGKSTLAGLIPRFFDPWEGRITLDGTDLRDLPVRWLREQVSVVLQEPFLFPLSVAENIAYGRPDASREEVEAAAKAANAHDFVMGLADGYESVLGERGSTLSGGQRQRLAIARALLKDAPLLILDEPTSALDMETEGLILEALSHLTLGRTCFIIAHRLSTIRNADRIVVLDEGRVAEQGTHEELLESGAWFAKLHGKRAESNDEKENGS